MGIVSFSYLFIDRPGILLTIKHERKSPGFCSVITHYSDKRIFFTVNNVLSGIEIPTVFLRAQADGGVLIPPVHGVDAYL
jgi:hypothetical protein